MKDISNEVTERTRNYDNLSNMSRNCMMLGDRMGYEVYKTLAKGEMASAIIALSRM